MSLFALRLALGQAARDALQMRERHFDLLPFTARPDTGIGLRDIARNVSGLLLD